VTVREVLVTGATGFVGAHVMEAFQGSATRVRAVVRPTSDTTQLRALGVDVRVAALTDVAALRAAATGADVIVHLAALTHARTEVELQRVNAGGTAAVADAAVQAGVGRVVYLSSLAAAGASAGRPVAPDDEPRPLTAYGRSKLAGEVELRKRATSFEAVILRAPAVYGPRDRELLRFFRLARIGLLPIPSGPDRPLQLVHVKDLARGIVAAATASHELRGTFHIADPQSYAWKDVCRLVGKAVGRTPLFLPVPQRAIAFAAAVSETVSSGVGRSTMFNRDKVRELLAPGWLCETDSARRAFGFAAEISLADGLRGTAEWYRTQGWL
jgi:nucleoside-diphosphate-sugar epimerase